jgi:hypothetical protein
MPQDRTRSPYFGFTPCTACDRVATVLIDFAHHFGARVAKSARGSTAERICSTHLGLVVGFTAPRELARWLRGVLTARRANPKSFIDQPCSLCDIERREPASSSARAAGPFPCVEHGGGSGRDFEALLDALGRLAAGESVDEAEERRLLRTALVQYASLRGTSAFLPRID